MFETQFALWLQSFSNETLDSFFLILTWLGYEQFLQALLVFIIFGINIRYGFILSQAIIWTAALTELFKHVFHYPRPFMVDNRLTLIGQPTVEPSPLTNQGATSFWSLLNSNTLGVARETFSHYSGSWGIPSGHTAGAVVIWGGLMHWFRLRWLWIICLLLIVLIPFSRLYLAMHFFADILLGYCLGLIMLQFFVRGIFNQPLITQWLFSGAKQKLFSARSFAFLLLFVLPGCGALFSTITPNESVTLILGSNLGFYAVWLKGVPIALPNVKHSISRLLIAYLLLSLVLVTDYLTDPWLVRHFGSLGSGVQEILLNALFIFGGIELMVKLGFLQRQALGSC